MPRVNLGKPNYNKIFSGEMDAAASRNFYKWKDVADRTGVCESTVRNYYNNPIKIPMGWLKAFVNVTNLDPDILLNYFYEGKYHAEPGGRNR